MRARTLARMRLRMISRELTETCSLERQADSESDMGVPLNDWAVVATEVPCRIIRAGNSMGGSNATSGGRESLVDKLRCIFAYDRVVSAEYRIVMADGRRYEVVDVVDDLTDKTFVQVIIKRLRDKTDG